MIRCTKVYYIDLAFFFCMGCDARASIRRYVNLPLQRKYLHIVAVMNFFLKDYFDCTKRVADVTEIFATFSNDRVKISEPKIQVLFDFCRVNIAKEMFRRQAQSKLRGRVQIGVTLWSWQQDEGFAFTEPEMPGERAENEAWILGMISESDSRVKIFKLDQVTNQAVSQLLSQNVESGSQIVFSGQLFLTRDNAFEIFQVDQADG
jgi:hypothetical protein